jgi:hypothetical protein
LRGNAGGSRWGKPAIPTGFWETVFSVIIEPAERRMQIGRGTPCEHPYETYQMN